MQGARRGRTQQRPPEGRGPGPPPPPTWRAAQQWTVNPPACKGQRAPPVGQPTRGRGVSTVNRPENPAQGATTRGARSRERRRGGPGSGRRVGGTPNPPTRRAALLRATTSCRQGQRAPPVGLPTRGQGVSQVSRPEHPAQGATAGGSRCRVPPCRSSVLPPPRRARTSRDRGVPPPPRPGWRGVASAGTSPPPPPPAQARSE